MKITEFNYIAYSYRIDLTVENIKQNYLIEIMITSIMRHGVIPVLLVVSAMHVNPSASSHHTRKPSEKLGEKPRSNYLNELMRRTNLAY